MQVLFFIIFAIIFFHEILYYIYLWQVKEYRRDRFAAGLRTNHDVAKTLANSFNLLVWFRPKLTFRALTTFCLALTFSLLFFIFLLPITYTYAKYFLLILLAPFFSSLAVAILTPFFVYWKKHLIEKATDKMREFGGTVIGISGSFGKSSTKEILAWLLSDKFSVLKTKKNVNSAIGLAKTILHDLKGDEQFFICEMGAYRRGEISEMCEIVKPKAGILTGLGDQHLDMFGSLENIKKAKMELIDSLPPTGFGLVLGRDFLKATPRILKNLETIWNLIITQPILKLLFWENLLLQTLLRRLKWQSILASIFPNVRQGFLFLKAMIFIQSLLFQVRHKSWTTHITQVLIHLLRPCHI